MKLRWISAVVLGAGRVAENGSKGDENAQNPAQTAAAPAADATGVDRQAVSPDSDNSALQPDSSGSRATAGTRAASSPKTPPPARKETRNVTPREAAAPVPIVHEVTVPAGTVLPLELTTA